MSLPLWNYFRDLQLLVGPWVGNLESGW